MVAESKAPLGRPRDPRVDAAALRATRELLCELGYADTTIDRIARRARVSRTAIYRRWPSKALIVHEAVFPPADGRLHVAARGDLETDLRELVAGAVVLFGRPEVVAALPGLMADAAADERLRAAFRAGLESTAGNELARLLDEARSRGEVRSGVTAGTLMHLLAGTLLVRAVAWGTGELEPLADELGDLLLHACRG